MPAFNFPNSPIPGQKHEENGVTYEWTGKVWNIYVEPDNTDIMLDRKVNRSGDHMLGQLLAAPGAPTDPHSVTSQAWQKQNFIQEAPSDAYYARRGAAPVAGTTVTAEDGEWVKTEAFVDAPSKTDMTYGRWESQWRPVTEEVESDGKLYGRQDTKWVETVSKKYVDDVQLEQDIMIDRKVNRGGDTMLAPLHLPPANPTHGYEAVHKNYVDERTGVQEAPDDGKVYARTNPTGAGSTDATWIETVTREEMEQPAHDLRRKINRDGDGMLGPLTLPPANPIHGYEAAHKNYVDTKLEEAPVDGLVYVRVNASWEPVPQELADVPIALDRKVDRAGDHMLGELLAAPGEPIDPHAVTSNAWQKQHFIQEAPASDTKLYGRRGGMPVPGVTVTALDGEWDEIGLGINDAPVDGVVYGRKDEQWVPSVEEAEMSTRLWARSDGLWRETLSKEAIEEKNLEQDINLDRKVWKHGDHMSGFLRLHADPDEPMHAVTKRYVDARTGTIFTELEPPANPSDGAMWWDEDTGGLYVYYDDGNSKQWVQVNGALGGGVSASLDSAPVDDIAYGFRNKAWTPVHRAMYGDVKNCFLSGDHHGWVRLDGRSVQTLTPRQLIQAQALGFTINLPNATNVVLMQGGVQPGSIYGSMSRSVTIAQGNLPNVTLTAGSAGAHTHPVPWSGTTNAALGFSDKVGTGPETGKIAAGGTGQYYIKADSWNIRDYNHSHTVSGNATASSGGAHTHNVPLGGSGTPLNIDVTPQSMTVNVFVYLGM